MLSDKQKSSTLLDLVHIRQFANLVKQRVRNTYCVTEVVLFLVILSLRAVLSLEQGHIGRCRVCISHACLIRVPHCRRLDHCLPNCCLRMDNINQEFSCERKINMFFIRLQKWQHSSLLRLCPFIYCIKVDLTKMTDISSSRDFQFCSICRI